MRVLTLCLLACLLAGCGGSLPPVDVVQNAVCLGSPDYVARADVSGGTRIVESHAGVLFCDVPGEFSGTLAGCIAMDEWTSEKWQAARKELGLDPLACVVSMDGSVRLCPANAPLVE